MSNQDNNLERGRVGYSDSSPPPMEVEGYLVDDAAHYHDFSRATNSIEKEGAHNFPMKLHLILSNPEFQDIIAWLPHGRAWRILQHKAFEEQVIPLYFRHGRYSSFARQVNGWAFKRITCGPDYNSYYHEMFLRGKPQLCKKMKRLASKETRNHDTDNALDAPVPDFYAISREYPLPELTGFRSTDPVIQDNQKVQNGAPSTGYLDDTTNASPENAIAALERRRQEILNHFISLQPGFAAPAPTDDPNSALLMLLGMQQQQQHLQQQPLHNQMQQMQQQQIHPQQNMGFPNLTSTWASLANGMNQQAFGAATNPLLFSGHGLPGVQPSLHAVASPIPATSVPGNLDLTQLLSQYQQAATAAMSPPLATVPNNSPNHLKDILGLLLGGQPQNSSIPNQDSSSDNKSAVGIQNMPSQLNTNTLPTAVDGSNINAILQNMLNGANLNGLDLSSFLQQQTNPQPQSFSFSNEVSNLSQDDIKSPDRINAVDTASIRDPPDELASLQRQRIEIETPPVGPPPSAPAHASLVDAADPGDLQKKLVDSAVLTPELFALLQNQLNDSSNTRGSFNSTSSTTPALASMSNSTSSIPFGVSNTGQANLLSSLLSMPMFAQGIQQQNRTAPTMLAQTLSLSSMNTQQQQQQEKQQQQHQCSVPVELLNHNQSLPQPQPQTQLPCDTTTAATASLSSSSSSSVPAVKNEAPTSSSAFSTTLPSTES